MNTTSSTTAWSPEDLPQPASSSPASPPPDEQLLQETRQQIRELVNEIAHLAQQDVPLDTFFAALLDRVLSALVAEGGAVWLRQDGETLSLRYQVQAAAWLPTEENGPHRQLLYRVLMQGQPLAAPPHSGFPDDQQSGNPTDYLLLLVPLVVEQEPAGVLEIVQRPGAGAVTQRGYLRFLVQIAELATGFLKSHRLRQYAERDRVWNRLDQFLSHVHASLDQEETAAAIVNEARLFLECDRVTLVLSSGAIAAVSGIDEIDRRSLPARRLTALANSVMQSGEAFWSRTPADDIAPQLIERWQNYADAAHVRSVALLPLASFSHREDDGATRPQRILGVLVLEQIARDDWPSSVSSRLPIVLRYATPALEHALTHSAIPWRNVASLFAPATWKQRGFSPAARGLAVAVALLLLSLTLLWPCTNSVAVRGRVVPALRRDLFAPDTGVVAEVHVRHGSQVRTGDLLVRMESAELALHITNLQGRERVLREELQALERSVLESSSGGQPTQPPGELERQGSQMQQLQQALLAVERELALLVEKQQRLEIRAPQDGEVVSWQVEKQLLRRPVEAGQVLLTLVDRSGPWELELDLPERRLSTLDAANQSTLGELLPVVAVLSSFPGREVHGEVTEVERIAQPRDGQGNAVLVRVQLTSGQTLPILRSDTGVSARIECGRTTLGQWLFGDLLAALQRYVWYWW